VIGYRRIYMEREKEEILEEAIQLELNMSNLYLFYRESFEDKAFWKQMAKEEREHAALLELAKDFFDKFPKEIIYNNLNELKGVNKDIKDTIDKYKKELPARGEAYEYAFGVENSAYELHYHKLLTDKSNSEEIKTFQKLNAADKDHAERINKLLAKK
jgi:rubrerythrin